MSLIYQIQTCIYSLKFIKAKEDIKTCLLFSMFFWSNVKFSIEFKRSILPCMSLYIVYIYGDI